MISYAYDTAGQLTSAADSDSAYVGDHIALEFGGSIPSYRYLHGPAIEQVFADENLAADTRFVVADRKIGRESSGRASNPGSSK